MPLQRALPQLRELRRKTSRVLCCLFNFTATSQQLHSNFTQQLHRNKSSHAVPHSHRIAHGNLLHCDFHELRWPLHANFTRTSQTSHRFTITKSVTKLRRYPAVLGGGHYGFYLRDTSAIQFQVSYPFAFRRANGNDQFPVTTHLLPEGTRPYLRLCPSVYQYVSHFPRSYVKDRLWDFAFYGLRTREPCRALTSALCPLQSLGAGWPQNLTTCTATARELRARPPGPCRCPP